MANLVLVHGAWHGAWCWSKLVPLLVAQGHNVSAPELPGHGDDRTPVTRVSMKKYVRRIVEAVGQFDGKVILVGHSMGGLVISQVAEQIPTRIDQLVYISALLLQNGDSLLARMQHEQGQSLAVATEDGTALVVPDDVLNEVFYSDCSDEDRAWAKPRLVAQAALPFTTPIAVSDDAFGTVPRAYIHCDLDKVIPIEEQTEMVAAWPCGRVEHVSAGHMVMISAPGPLASALALVIG